MEALAPVVTARCTARHPDGLDAVCELPLEQHVVENGLVRHAFVTSRDDEGRVEDGVTWLTPAVPADAVPAPTGLDVTDPQNAEFVALLSRSVPTIRVLDLYDDADAFIAQVEAQLAGARARRKYLQAIVDAKMRDDKAEVVVHTAPSNGLRLTATMKAGEKQVERRIDVLTQLQTLQNEDGAPLIPEEELCKAIWTERPEPVVKTHLTHLRALKKYGAKVQDILDEGLVETQGVPVLVIEREKPSLKNVTPVKSEAF